MNLRFHKINIHRLQSLLLILFITYNSVHWSHEHRCLIICLTTQKETFVSTVPSTDLNRWKLIEIFFKLYQHKIIYNLVSFIKPLRTNFGRVRIYLFVFQQKKIFQSVWSRKVKSEIETSGSHVKDDHEFSNIISRFRLVDEWSMRSLFSVWLFLAGIKSILLVEVECDGIKHKEHVLYIVYTFTSFTSQCERNFMLCNLLHQKHTHAIAVSNELIITIRRSCSDDER